jgi:TLD
MPSFWCRKKQEYDDVDIARSESSGPPQDAAPAAAAATLPAATTPFWCCRKQEFDDGEIGRSASSGPPQNAAAAAATLPAAPRTRDHEDDLKAIRSWRLRSSWRQRQNITSGGDDMEENPAVPPPPIQILEVDPSLPGIVPSEEGIELSATMEVEATKNRQFLIEQQQDGIELSPMTECDQDWKEQQLIYEQQELLANPGGFPTFTEDETEALINKELLKDSYLSSSSASSASSGEPIFRPSPNLLDNKQNERYASGPVDLDDLSLSRPDTDDGDSQPAAPHHHQGAVEVSDISFRQTAEAEITTTPQPSSPRASPTSSGSGGRQQQSTALNSSAESEVLDAIVAAIDDHTQQQHLHTAQNDHPLLTGSNSVATLRTSTTTPPQQQQQQQQRSISALALPTLARTPPSAKRPQRLIPNYRDSPSVHDPAAYGDGQSSSPALRSSSPALISPSNSDDNIMTSRNASSPVPPKSTADQRRRDRSRSRGSPSTRRKRQTPSPSSPLKHNSVSSSSPRFPPATNSSAEVSVSSSQLNDDDYDDRLSEVPSDVAPEVKERFLTACRILKSALIEKDTKLQPSEKNFLASLLLESSETDEAPTEAHDTSTDSAAATRSSNPLLDSTTSVASSAFSRPESHIAQGEQQSRSLSTESHAMTRMSESTLQTHNIRRPLGENHDNEDKLRRSPWSQTSSSLFSREGDNYPFKILGAAGFKPTVLTPTVMEALRGFFPYAVAEENFLLKFALERDGAALMTLLSKVQSCRHTIISVETVDGYVFGAFCFSPWRVQSAWFGSGESFLWRLKKPRIKNNNQTYDNDSDNEIEIYPYTGHDELIQYCTTQTLAVGGGTDWTDTDLGSPYEGEPSGTGFLIDGDLMGGETSSCVTFANPRLGDRSARTNEFDIHALEVWTVTPCLTIEDAEEMQMRRMFLDELSSTGL